MQLSFNHSLTSVLCYTNLQQAPIKWITATLPMVPVSQHSDLQEGLPPPPPRGSPRTATSSAADRWGKDPHPSSPRPPSEQRVPERTPSQSPPPPAAVPPSRNVVPGARRVSTPGAHRLSTPGAHRVATPRGASQQRRVEPSRPHESWNRSPAQQAFDHHQEHHDPQASSSSGGRGDERHNNWEQAVPRAVPPRPRSPPRRAPPKPLHEDDEQPF